MRWATRRGCHVDRTACVWPARLQIVVLYMLLGLLSYRSFFTPRNQLRSAVFDK